MCGIAGYISFQEILDTSNLDTVKNMASVLVHRGPDSQGILHDSRVVLGNTRLSIIDTSDNGALPMAASDDSVWLCYNGEISNFRELREKYELEKKFDFRSTSDSEVLLYLYKQLGISLLDELSGMFAFCLYDRTEQIVYLVRDFYGILPLFVHQTSDGLYFSSEIKSFLEIPSFEKKVDRESIHHFFSLAYIPGSRTPFVGIQEIQGGELVKIKLGERPEFRNYYKLDYREDHSIDEKSAVETTRELLVDSVKRSLVSDAPLGMTLSGGIDTSAMLGIVKHLGLGSQMHTFSLRMGEKSFDESPYQRLMAEYAGSIHHEITVNPDDVVRHMLTQISHMDEPNGNGACIPSFILAKEASSTVKVLLSGEGGDELFNAYPTMAAYQYRNIYRKFPKPIRDLVRYGVHQLPADYRKLSFDFKAKRFTTGAELSVPHSHLFWRHVLTEDQKSKLLIGDFERVPTTDYYDKIYYESGIENELNRLSLIDMRHFFIDDLMVKNDRTFLANSVEGRFPFLDRPLVDYVTKLPVKYRARFGNLRWVEKEAMRPFLPNEILKRDGFGLEMPHAIWFFDKLGSFAKKYLNREMVESTGLLNWKEVELMWNLHMAGKQDLGRPLWCLLNYLIWFDLFIRTGNYKDYWNHQGKQATFKQSMAVVVA
ncbi:MAG: asparagine synthase (glutamine-hydrolyzing) [Flavobacteriales bacterium]|nr:asparagine synthase (glutamine-hydrolyzing) [Flavobacteriales bacterium]